MTTTRTKPRRNSLSSRAGSGKKLLIHSSGRTEEKASYFLGTNSRERFTRKRCCITLIQARKDRGLNINRCSEDLTQKPKQHHQLELQNLRGMPQERGMPHQVHENPVVKWATRQEPDILGKVRLKVRNILIRFSYLFIY